MLSWSGNEEGETIDLSEVAAGAGGTGLQHGDALLRFATACAERDDAELASARLSLAEETDEAFMIDAAGVAANFEMMTRLADGTGSRMPAGVIENNAATIGIMGVADLTSRR